MRLIIAAAAAAFAAACAAPFAKAPPAPVAPETPSARAAIMVLGTYHFTGGGADYVNTQVDDHLAPGRQAEIQAVAERLAAFAPTKIAVELTLDGEGAFNADYDAYRRGERALTVNERQQIGMRLAAMLDHDRLYAVDHASDMDFEAMTQAAGAAGQTWLLERLPELQAKVGALDAALSQPGVTVTERLAGYNDPAFLASHDIYLTLAQMGARDAPVGAEEMEEWWGRNLKIFASVAQITEPGDRILVIYGSGHKFLLDQFVQDAVEFDWVDVGPYLTGE